MAVMACALLGSVHPRFMEFAIGMTLARMLSLKTPRIGVTAAASLVAADLLLLGIPDHGAGAGEGVYTALASVVHDSRLGYVYDTGAVMIMPAVLCCPSFHRALDCRVSRWLGAISFPIYILHMLVQCSIGCRIFLAAWPLGRPVAIGLAVAITVAMSVVIASLAAPLDKAWARLIDRAVGLILDNGRRKPTSSPGMTLSRS